MSFSKCDLLRSNALHNPKKLEKEALGGVKADELLEDITKVVIQQQVNSAKNLK